MSLWYTVWMKKSKVRTVFPNFVSILWLVYYRLSMPLALMMGRAFWHYFLSRWPPVSCLFEVALCWALISAIQLWTGVQKRFNTAGLRLPSSKRPICKVGSWLAFGNLDFGRVPTILRTDKNGPPCFNSLYKQCALWCAPAFLPGVWNFGTCQVEAVLMSPPPPSQ